MAKNALEHEPSVSVVSLPMRLAWLAAALWVIALKVALVAEFTPVELTTDGAHGIVYGLAIGVPIAALLAWIIRSGIRAQWMSGLVASLLLGAMLYAGVAAGLPGHVLFQSGPWETEDVLYVHRDDPERRIERQVRRSIGPQYRFVQTRPLTSFLAYVEPVDPARIQAPQNLSDNWRPGVDLLRYLR